MSSNKKLVVKAEGVLEGFRRKKLKLAIAESCTGGLLSMLLTEVPGSSDVFERGFITYSNASKTDMLGVSAPLIRKHGAVSREVVEAMARGAIAHSKADVAIAITGVAGPGASENKPAGMVHMAIAAKNDETVFWQEFRFDGDRTTVRSKAASNALSQLRKAAALL